MEKTIRLAGPADIDAIFDIRTRVHENRFSRDQLVEMGITPATIQKAILEAHALGSPRSMVPPSVFLWLMSRKDVCSPLSFYPTSRGTDWGAD
ncbi:hypothetical protein [Xanthomonas sp. BRIP62409]|uniref:hypothetical protein n=1 Tax=Xanthomonas sp. BRIP62409 TaxID=2182388 RepID=UPI001F49D1D8|nr:hypothetical protein [Xanthomonas sp. BRIP62409]